MFFRELPEPLFPFRFFPLFVDAISKSSQKQVSPTTTLHLFISAGPTLTPTHLNQVHLCLCTEMKDSKCKLQRMKKLIGELPKPNQDTMKVLFSHLLR